MSGRLEPQPDDDRWFVNHYVCPNCDASWSDEWSCACNDECPYCSTSDIEPVESKEIPNQWLK